MNRLRFLVPLGVVFALSGCYQQMSVQPAYRPLDRSTFFKDGRSSRPVLEGTVARGQLRTDTAMFKGRDDKGELVAAFPMEMTPEVLKRGEQRYNVFCAVCHGKTGEGNGRIVQRGFTVPPNYHTDDSRAFALKGTKVKLSDVAVGHIYDVISRGYGAMAEHGSQIPVRDRWAIAGYVRVLQASRQPEPKGEKK